MRVYPPKAGSSGGHWTGNGGDAACDEAEAWIHGGGGRDALAASGAIGTHVVRLQRAPREQDQQEQHLRPLQQQQQKSQQHWQQHTHHHEQYIWPQPSTPDVSSHSVASSYPVPSLSFPLRFSPNFFSPPPTPPLSPSVSSAIAAATRHQRSMEQVGQHSHCAHARLTLFSGQRSSSASCARTNVAPSVIAPPAAAAAPCTPRIGRSHTLGCGPSCSSLLLFGINRSRAAIFFCGVRTNCCWSSTCTSSRCHSRTTRVVASTHCTGCMHRGLW